MKVLFNCNLPFSLIHGGAPVQIEQTIAGLKQVGVEVEHLQWWNNGQTTDILHHVGYMEPGLTARAHDKGWKVANTVLFTETVNRSAAALRWRGLGVRLIRKGPWPRRLKDLFPWRTYHGADRMIVGLEAERDLLRNVYGVPAGRIEVVPLGLAEIFLQAGPPLRTEDHLICTGRITPSKNSLQLARLARDSRVPVLFVGKSEDSSSDYWKQFQALVDNRYVKHHEHVGSAAGIVDLLRRARGYVLMSQYENWSLAAHEAAACGLPLLLPDQPWSRERFADQASYFPTYEGPRAAAALRTFYDACPALPPPRVQLIGWPETGRMLRDVYAKMLR